MFLGPANFIFFLSKSVFLGSEHGFWGSGSDPKNVTGVRGLPRLLKASWNVGNAIRNTHFQKFRACGALEVNYTLSTSNARGAFRDLAPTMIFRVSWESFFGVPNRVFGVWVL